MEKHQETFFGCDADYRDARIVIFGAPFDSTTSYRPGTRDASRVMRAEAYGLETFSPYQDLDLVDAQIFDSGDLELAFGDSEKTLAIIEERAAEILSDGKTPFMLGGEHLVTLGAVRAAAKKYPDLCVVHFDAHTDTVSSYFGKDYCHGTPFYHAVKEGLIDPAHSIQVGMRGNLYEPDGFEDSKKLGLEIITASEMHKIGIDETIRRIKERVGDKLTFLTFDIDFVDPAYAPGTGTIEIGGFTSVEAMDLICGIKDLNVVGFDLVEVAPQYDPTERTQFLAANIVHDFIGMVALKRRDK